jgi:DNA replication protein DnaC
MICQQVTLSGYAEWPKMADAVIEARVHNAIALRWKQSKLAEKLTIDQFDFSHHKSRQEQKTRLLNLLTLDFARAHMEVILIGNPGTGKTFLPHAWPMPPVMPTSRSSLPRL